MSRIEVLIVDDHAMVRAGLRMLLDAEPDIRVVGEAGTVAEAIEVGSRLQPSIITLDLSMPGPSGVAAIPRLRAAVPKARIIVLTMHDDPAYVRSAMAMGAAGFINKSAANSELTSAIRAVARGRMVLDLGNAATIESIFSPDDARRGRTPVERLSEREREVLRQVALGYTNRQIADEIGLSVKTIESYRARLMKKLSLRERADLVRVAIELGLVGDT